MSLEQDQIRQGLAEFAARFGPAAIAPALVLAINNDDTIQIQFSDDAVIDDCRLKSVVKEGNRVIMVPKVDSIVLVARIENSDEYVVVAVEEITKILYLIGDARYEVDESGHLIEAGGENLLDVLIDFAEACITERHTTKNGPTINMTALSKQKFINVKSRLQKILRNA